MNDTFNQSSERFGQHPEESQNLVRVWAASQPEVPVQEWGSFWAETLAKSTTARPSASVGGSSGLSGRIIKLGLAASLAGLLWANWPTGEQPGTGPVRVALTQTNTEPIVSINLDEADALAIIRLDDAECRADKPCLETVEPISAEAGGAALASNFQLFNDLESLAGE